MNKAIAAALSLIMLAAPIASRPKRDQMFDQLIFGECADLAARLDNFAIELSFSGNLQAKGLVRVYAGKEVRRGEGQFYVGLIKNYLIGQRGIGAHRFDVIFSGYREEAGADVHIMPSGMNVGPMRTLELKDVVFRKEAFKTRKFACAKPRRGR